MGIIVRLLSTERTNAPLLTLLQPETFDAALIIPIAFLSLPVLWLSNRLYTNYAEKKRLKALGIGRGVPGFLTGVQKVALPLAIVARIKMGEDVSAEEITDAINAEKAREIRLAELEAEEAAAAARDAERDANWKAGELKPMKVPKTVDTEWLPQGALDGASSKGGRRRKK
ncbi:hypothetical protein RQP46_006776 [Phenoliferia psychrophenolica]